MTEPRRCRACGEVLVQKPREGRLAFEGRSFCNHSCARMVSGRKAAPLTQCSAEGCLSDATRKAAQLCEMHYYRLRRTGTTATRVTIAKPVHEPFKARQRQICVMDGCDQIDDGSHGFCKKHYTRIRRHGDPTVVIAQADRLHYRGREHPGWKGDNVTYNGAHLRVRAQRGSASNYTCACGSAAKQWAYRHDDPNEKQSTFGPYSSDPEHYDPMCVPCHKRMDLEYLESAS